MNQPFAAAVLGHPIGHSQSPPLHHAAYQALGAPIDYRRFDLQPEQLPDFMSTLAQREPIGADWLGFSVTMPLKGAMVPLVDRLSDRVQTLGFLNTVVFDSDGTKTAYNTDVEGIVEALTFAGLDPHQSGGVLGILGGGGTAAAALAAATLMSISDVELLVRSPEKAEEHRKLAENFGLKPTVRLIDEFAERASGYRAIVSTLPPRAADSYAERLMEITSARRLPPLLDAAYDPWPTRLAEIWQNCGGQVVSGMEMLLYQAVEQVRLFTERIPEVSSAPQRPDWSAVTEAMAHAVGLPSRSPLAP